jgi:hypothetical protein
MKYRKLGKSGIDVSVIGHGTWALGNDFFGAVDEERPSARSRSLDLGVNWWIPPRHTARLRGEYAVGRALKGRRDKVVHSPKFGVHRIMGEYVRCLSPGVVRQGLKTPLNVCRRFYRRAVRPLAGQQLRHRRRARGSGRHEKAGQDPRRRRSNFRWIR